MSSEHDPPRLRETGDPALAELLPGLARARSQEVDPEQLARICAGVAARAAQPAQRGAQDLGGSETPAAAGAGATKLLKLLLVGGLLGGAAFFGMRQVQPVSEIESGSTHGARVTGPDRSLAGPAPEPPQPTLQPPASAPARQQAEPAPLALSAETAERAAPPRGVHATSPGARRPRGAPAALRTPDSAAELALLKRARAEVRSNAAHALALSDEHAARFVHGLLAEEREVIAIEALLVLERTAQAQARARAFFVAHPASAHARRVRGLLSEHAAALPEENPGTPVHPSR